MGYRLREGVHFCISSGRTVFFDLPNCRYSALPDATDIVFQALVAAQCPTPSQVEDLTPLLDSGLLVEEAHASTRLTGASPLPVRRSLIEGDRPPANANAVLGALTAQVLAALDLKHRSLARIFASLRKTTAGRTLRSEVPFDELAAIASAFYWSQRIIPSNDKCLRRSIALAAYLRRKRIASQLVIGVRMRPFAAHAWVQHGDLVLNEAGDEARRYTTILLV